jgi:hypothetical protein
MTAEQSYYQIAIGSVVLRIDISTYKHDCYIKPCELEDEHGTPSFPFLQGQFRFHRTHCDALYVAKNFPSYYVHPRCCSST